MPTFAAVTSAHVERAIAEHVALGAADFHARHRFEEPGEYVLLHNGATYDAKAILGVAHLHATGFQALADQFTAASAAKILAGRGFTVRDLDGNDPFAAPARPTRAPRTPRTPRATRAARPEPAPPAICPRCFMALPATGVCDDCS